MSMAHSITDVTAIKWKGDLLGRASQSKAEGEAVLGNMGPSVDVADDAVKTSSTTK